MLITIAIALAKLNNSFVILFHGIRLEKLPTIGEIVANATPIAPLDKDINIKFLNDNLNTRFR